MVIEVTFAGKGQKLFEQKLGIDISGRDPADEPNGILYETIGESCIPGINCLSYENIFEEQVVVQSMTASQQVTSLINSNVFFLEEKVFFFGTLVPSNFPDGIFEKFKIMNPNKIACTVKFDVHKKSANQNEQFAFEIATKQAKIPPHEHIYLKLFFKPSIMAQYAGVFEAVVDFGEQSPKTHRLVFDVRGEGAIPTLKLERPREFLNESTPVLRFPKVRLEKSAVLPVVLKNDGPVPATVRWDLVANPSFSFLGQNLYSITPKTSATFNIEFRPTEVGLKQWQIALQTVSNPFELTKLMVQGEGFFENVVFENLPNDREDEVSLGDCCINVEKAISFEVKNNGEEVIRFA